VLSELAVSGGPSVLIIDDLHELSYGYGENARAGVKAHLDTVTERGRVHHREIHRVLAAVNIEVFIATTPFAAGHRSFPVLKLPAAGSQEFLCAGRDRSMAIESGHAVGLVVRRSPGPPAEWPVGAPCACRELLTGLTAALSGFGAVLSRDHLRERGQQHRAKVPILSQDLAVGGLRAG